MPLRRFLRSISSESTYGSIPGASTIEYLKILATIGCLANIKNPKEKWCHLGAIIVQERSFLYLSTPQRCFCPARHYPKIFSRAFVESRAADELDSLFLGCNLRWSVQNADNLGLRQTSLQGREVSQCFSCNHSQLRN